MTRKDYVLLAEALKARTTHQASNDDVAVGWHLGVSACTHALADALARENPRFDRARFLRAAGVN